MHSMKESHLRGRRKVKQRKVNSRVTVIAVIAIDRQGSQTSVHNRHTKCTHNGKGSARTHEISSAKYKIHKMH